MLEVTALPNEPQPLPKSEQAFKEGHKLNFVSGSTLST